MLKWRLFLTTLPYVVAALACKLALERLGFLGVLEFSDIGLVLTGGVFLIGFMLSGTMADYKESEKIPAELACTLEHIEEMLTQAAIGRPAVDGARHRRAVLEAGQALWDWLHHKLAHAEMFAALRGLGERILELESVGASPHAGRAMRELHNLRRLATRVGVITRTGFIAAGYAFLEVLTAAILIMLMASHFKNLLTEVVLVSFITLIFIYMVRLIRDIDDPFEYSETGQVGNVEVELFPLAEYLERLRARVGAAASLDIGGAGG
jgi:hypothetical protein